MGCRFLLPGVFPTQGLVLGLLPCGWSLALQAPSVETPLNSVLGDSSAPEPGLQAASQPAETPAQQGKASLIATNR